MQAERNEKNRKAAIATADRLHSAAIHLLRWLRASDRESGIGPAQLSALSVLVFGGPQSLAELAQAEQVKAPTMSRIVKGLVNAKLAISVTDDRDRRAIHIQATDRGVRVMHAARSRRIETLARAVRGLSKKEIAELRKAAELMESLQRQL
jgi:DNA-binding MarR family transcriptional regulator